MNTYDWLTIRGVRDVAEQHFVEVSFNRGARKDFFYCPPETGVTTGDTVVVEAEGGGTDTGYVTLSGELVFAQLRRRKRKASDIALDVVRRAHDRDIDRLREARALEKQTLVRARVIAYATELPIKLSDVEYQADLRKATFYYTAEERVDFRELIKSLSREFECRVEMRQLGARQEAGRLGGIGSCGRELCCATWLTDFKNVNTSAARYQGLALNQTKLSGQCGRLKCCLNYELDTYLDALEEFPRKADKLRFPSGRAVLVKTDVFKRLMTYQVSINKVRGPYVTLTVAQVHEILANPEADVATLIDIDKTRQDEIAAAAAEEFDYEDVTGAIDIPLEKRQRGKKRTRGKSAPPNNRRGRSGGGDAGSREGDKSQDADGSTDGGSRKRAPRPPRNRDGEDRPPRKSGSKRRSRGSDGADSGNDGGTRAGGDTGGDTGAKRTSRNADSRSSPGDRPPRKPRPERKRRGDSGAATGSDGGSPGGNAPDGGDGGDGSTNKRRSRPRGRGRGRSGDGGEGGFGGSPNPGGTGE